MLALSHSHSPFLRLSFCNSLLLYLSLFCNSPSFTFFSFSFSPHHLRQPCESYRHTSIPCLFHLRTEHRHQAECTGRVKFLQFYTLRLCSSKSPRRFKLEPNVTVLDLNLMFCLMINLRKNLSYHWPLNASWQSLAMRGTECVCVCLRANIRLLCLSKTRVSLYLPYTH